MKKEYMILIALILILGAYLLFYKGNKDHYTLPEIPQIDVAKITSLTLDKKEGAIAFTKKGKNWVLTDKEYPADSPAVENMLDTIKTFKLSALVSQKGDLKRYELDNEHHIRVKLVQDEKTIFEFTLGKTAPSFNHTFVMLANDKNIYHANGSFKSYFDKPQDDFRDKKVLEFKQASIKQFTIEKEGVSKTLILKEDEKDPKKSSPKESDPKESNKKKTEITWTAEDGTVADKEAVSNLLSSVAFLECKKYVSVPSKNELEKSLPLCKITLKNEADIELTLFKTDNSDNLIGISSMNEYVFELSQFNGKEIVSNIEKLLNQEKADLSPKDIDLIKEEANLKPVP
ncbi:DUF4340 domain-containing protein [Desulfobacula phenolica]|uniref:DUF4340 domain-containing protein n=1 Tax=Desulfobacula phenolica TaxID=90732 RepID=A0A1H2DP24_9BACT|nr:DUF4340 domain-containing protein [Desulfobacula phenolica]SDT84118.1 protein of unknown function [Desulfobacula phenolica]